MLGEEKKTSLINLKRGETHAPRKENEGVSRMKGLLGGGLLGTYPLVSHLSCREGLTGT